MNNELTSCCSIQLLLIASVGLLRSSLVDLLRFVSSHFFAPSSTVIVVSFCFAQKKTLSLVEITRGVHVMQRRSNVCRISQFSSHHCVLHASTTNLVMLFSSFSKRVLFLKDVLHEKRKLINFKVLLSSSLLLQFPSLSFSLSQSPWYLQQLICPTESRAAGCPLDSRCLRSSA